MVCIGTSFTIASGCEIQEDGADVFSVAPEGRTRINWELQGERTSAKYEEELPNVVSCRTEKAESGGWR